MTVASTACPHALLYQDWDAIPDRPVIKVGGHWLVSTHALVRRVLADTETFSPDNALDAVTPMSTRALRILTRYGFRLPHTLANNSTHTHAGIRATVARFLSPRRVDEQRPFVADLVRARVAEAEAVLGRGEQVDLHRAISHALPLLVLGRLIRLPDDDVDVVKRFSASALELFWAPLDVRRQIELAEIVGEYHARLRQFARTGPGLAEALRERGERGERGELREDDIVAVLFFLLVAGQETTSQFLTALLHRLVKEPAICRDVANGVVSASDVVAEGLRMNTSVVTWRRVTTRETQLDGITIPANASVILRLASVGRDPEIVEHPDDFVPGQRGSRRHLSFGAGLHRCLGSHLATMEAEVVVAESAPLLSRCQVVRAPLHKENLSFRMPNALIVSGRAGMRA